MEVELKNRDNTIKELQLKIDRLEQLKCRHEDSSLNSRENANEELQREYDNLKEENSKLVTAMEKLHQTVQVMEDNLKSNEIMIQNLQMKSKEGDSSSNKPQAHVDHQKSLNSENEDLRNQLRNTEQHLNEKKEELDKLYQKCNSLERTNSDIAMQKKELEQLANSQRLQLKELEEKYLELKSIDTHRRREADNAIALIESNYKEQVASLEKEKQILENQLDSLKLDLKATKDQIKAYEASPKRAEIQWNEISEIRSQGFDTKFTAEEYERKLKLYEAELLKTKVKI